MTEAAPTLRPPPRRLEHADLPEVAPDLRAPYEVSGDGSDALLLPALSSISTRAEMGGLATLLASDHRCIVPDWPGFGNAPRPVLSLTPATLQSFLDRFVDLVVRPGAVGIAGGHSAAYLLRTARRDPDRFARLVLVAPTWRGPLPTMQQRSDTRLQRGLRTAIASPLLGEVLYRLNVSRPVVARMMRAHVYADPARVTQAVLAEKLAVTRQPRARHGTAAFVTGVLDPAGSRAEFLSLFGPDLPPILMLRPHGAPRRSGAEMDALAATGFVTTVEVPGALAAHEEEAAAVARAIRSWIAS